ncbi:transposase, isxo2-like domain-containing protein [Plakobranchus ocellatus]|uniref:Transposase, isxo2-like domain-containing protein n=1 Tax=Plakobranchus ocellatus TaxID=259542 RepID=A0AAV3Y189_9GAST|nr:transposase, isxo2-like domain-containing protein [Plakobranchus ocellatus]
MAAARPNLFPSVSGLNLRTLVAATSTTGDCIQWLRGLGLLATNKDCPQCGTQMREVNDAKRNDGKRWRCPLKTCKKECSIREGSFFGEGTRLELRVIIDLLYHYAYGNATSKNLSRECGLAAEAIVNWRNYVRDIFGEYFLLHPARIGGQGHIVEIDESVFNRRKAHVGRVLDTQWVFGGIDVQTKEGFLVAVPQRDAATLLPILQTYVLPGTTVMSDMWAAYNTINNIGYRHLTVNHNLNFVDPISGATTNHVESMWCRAKLRNKKECGTTRSLLDSYMIEFMWRMRFGEDPFENLISCIRERCQQDNGDEDTTHIGVGPGGDFQANNNLFDNLITGDETWVHLNTPETRRDSMTWKHPSSPVTQKFKVQSPDLAPSDFHLFGPLKRHLGDMAFETEDDPINELRNWFDNLDIDFFRVGINSLLSRWQTCIDLHGDYVEKLCKSELQSV